MKTLEELKQLKDELQEAYDTVLARQNEYDKSTVEYARKCAADAVTAFKFAQFNEFVKEENE